MRSVGLVGLKGMLVALVIGVGCVRSQLVLLPTPEPSLQSCRAGTGASFTVDEPSEDTPILVLRRPNGPPQPLLVVWRNGDVLVPDNRDSRYYQSQIGHIDPAVAAALVTDVVQLLEGEPEGEIGDGIDGCHGDCDRTSRLFVFSKGSWRIWSVTGWKLDELLHPEPFEAAYSMFQAQNPVPNKLCDMAYDPLVRLPTECDRPHNPPPPKIVAIHRKLLGLQPSNLRAFIAARHRVSFDDVTYQGMGGLVLPWPHHLPVPPMTSTSPLCSSDKYASCWFDFAPADNESVVKFRRVLERSPWRRTRFRFAARLWDFSFAEEYRGQRELEQVEACAWKLGILKFAPD